jgi:precorrin-4 methylase
LQGFENQFLSYDILNNYLKSRVNESLSRIGFDFKFPVVKSVVDVTEWMDEEVFASALSDLAPRVSPQKNYSNERFLLGHRRDPTVYGEGVSRL